jgi:hypothetical protein
MAMAERYFSVTQFGNDSFSAVVENAASQAGNPVEIRITYDAANNSRERTLRAIKAISAFLTKDTWPPV